jgi:hypothetical protein
MSKTRRYNKRGGFIEHVTNSISTSSKGALDTVNKSASDAGNSIGSFFSNGYNSLFGTKKTDNTYKPSYNSVSSYSNNPSYNNSSSYTNAPSYSNMLSSTRLPSTTIPTSNSSLYNSISGGRRIKRRRGTKKNYFGGNVIPNRSLNNIASHASPISGIKTAKPCSWVGGKSKRYRRQRKSRKV